MWKKCFVFWQEAVLVETIEREPQFCPWLYLQSVALFLPSCWTIPRMHGGRLLRGVFVFLHMWFGIFCWLSSSLNQSELYQTFGDWCCYFERGTIKMALSNQYDTMGFVFSIAGKVTTNLERIQDHKMFQACDTFANQAGLADLPSYLFCFHLYRAINN